MIRFLNFTVALLIAVGIVSCGANHRAKQLVKGHLKITLNDYASYEPLLFGNVDSLWSTLADDSVYVRMTDSMGYYLQLSQKYQDDAYKYLAKADMSSWKSVRDLNISFARDCNDLAEKALECCKNWRMLAQRISDGFEPQFIGWKLSHSFRARNEDGVLNIYNRIFCFDKDMTTVTRSMENKENGK